MILHRSQLLLLCPVRHSRAGGNPARVGCAELCEAHQSCSELFLERCASLHSAHPTTLRHLRYVRYLNNSEGLGELGSNTKGLGELGSNTKSA